MAPVKKSLRPLKTTFLLQWRENAGLGQEAAADLLNISRTLLSKIENARSPYSQRILEHAAEIYGCTPAELLARNPKDTHSLWPLWERAEKTVGRQRDQIRKLLNVALEEA